MKRPLLFLSLLFTCSTPFVCAESNPNAPVLDPEPYQLDRYQRLMSKSPFDFEQPTPPPAPEIKAMADWALAGLTKASDGFSVTLLNLKTNERLRLNHYVSPPSPKANQTNMGSDVYVLQGVQFEEGKPQQLKYASAVVTKNGAQDNVPYNEAILKSKPAGGPMQAMGGNRGGQPVIGPNGQPMPNAAGGQNNNNALMQMLQSRNNGGQQPAVPGQAQPQPILNGSTQNSNVNVQPIITPQNGLQPNPTPQVQPQPQLQLNMTQPQPMPQASGNGFPTNSGGGENNGAPARRRVVLPNNNPPAQALTAPPPNP
jgi:hypothetical protein